MTKHGENETRESEREIMKGPHGRGQGTAGTREIMKGAQGRGQNTAGDHELMQPKPRATRAKPSSRD